jgi:hypothetical protein
MSFKMTCNEANHTRWEHENGKIFLYLTHGELCIHFMDMDKQIPTRLNVAIGDGLLRFLAGSPDDLREALLCLTNEYKTETLAGSAFK